METRQPKVTLINSTQRPLETLAWVCKIYAQEGLDSLDKLKEVGLDSEEKIKIFLEPFLKEPHQTFMEYIHCQFLIENVSRAFQQQLTRHRLAAFAIQSLRVYDVGSFATGRRYTIPSTVQNPSEFHRCMEELQYTYREMVAAGENLEDARGILPLNIHSTITMSVNFNSLRHILQGRLCLTAQEEARKVGYLIKKAVHEKMGQFFGDLLQPPCHKIYGGKCTREAWYCGVPLYEASTDPEAFKEWYKSSDGKPDATRLPTNVVILPEDIETIKEALAQEAK